MVIDDGSTDNTAELVLKWKENSEFATCLRFEQPALSSRTSPQTGVGIPLGFRLFQGIATPVTSVTGSQ